MRIKAEAACLPDGDVVWCPFVGAAEFLQHLWIGDGFGELARADTGDFLGGAALQVELGLFGVPRDVVGDDDARVVAER